MLAPWLGIPLVYASLRLAQLAIQPVTQGRGAAVADLIIAATVIRAARGGRRSVNHSFQLGNVSHCGNSFFGLCGINRECIWQQFYGRTLLRYSA